MQFALHLRTIKKLNYLIYQFFLKENLLVMIGFRTCYFLTSPTNLLFHCNCFQPYSKDDLKSDCITHLVKAHQYFPTDHRIKYKLLTKNFQDRKRERIRMRGEEYESEMESWPFMALPLLISPVHPLPLCNSHTGFSAS